MPYLQGVARDEPLALPATLDEYITPDNSVRVIDAFIDQLDLHTLGFVRATPKSTGRPAYPPATLLKLYLYGYLNRIRSSRGLERETQRNIEVMWLLKRLTPDHKTIADFRKDNLEPLQAVCRAFTCFCQEQQLFGGTLVAIDGSKFKALNNYKRNFNAQRLERAIAQMDEAIARYLVELDAQDAQQHTPPSSRRQAIETTLTNLRTRKAQYELLQAELQQSGETQISLTDPDSRAMPVSQGTMVAYNVQISVDAKHKLILDHQVTQAISDQHLLASMAERAKAILGLNTLEVLADRGYYDGEQIKQCLKADITPWVPKPLTSANAKQGLFTKEDFHYDAEGDVYRCPQGAELTFRFQTVEAGRDIRYYTTAACRSCPIKARCTRNKRSRRITRWVDEQLLEQMAARIRATPERTKQRKTLVEHPFGTMKRGMRQHDFLLRGKAKVAAEMSLTVLAYNLRRVLTILGVTSLLEQLKQTKTVLLVYLRRAIWSASYLTSSTGGQTRGSAGQQARSLSFSGRLFTQSQRLLGGGSSSCLTDAVFQAHPST
jgi:transposase